MSGKGPSLFPWEEEGAAGDAQMAGAQPVEEQPSPENAASAERGTPADGEAAASEAAPDDADALARAPVGGDSAAREAAQRQLVRKEYYSISEVSDLVGLPAHVLRYWESQFSVLNPSKNRSGNRVYQRKEIKLILLVKQLLHEEKYTVEGAKQKLEQLRRGGGLGPATRQALDGQLLRLLREDLQALGELLKTDTD
jgi:DNA-binding transcriptional MerR regulator